VNTELPRNTQAFYAFGRRSPASNHVEGDKEDWPKKNDSPGLLHVDSRDAPFLPLPHYFDTGRILPAAIGPFMQGVSRRCYLQLAKVQLGNWIRADSSMVCRFI
jgi:hypothetical protein